jgi:hypothetical protein
MSKLRGTAVSNKPQPIVTEEVEDVGVGEIVKGEDICFDFRPTVKGRPGRRASVDSVKDTPLVFIGGVAVELTKVETKDLPRSVALHTRHMRHSSNILIPADNNRFHIGQWSNNSSVILPDDIQWYHFELAGIKVYLSQGSELIINENFSIDNYYEYDFSEDGEYESEEHLLTLVGSSLVTNRLSLRGSTYLNNTEIHTRESVELYRATVLTSSVRSKRNVNINKSTIRSSSFGESSSLSVVDSNMTQTFITTAGDIVLREVTSHALFRYNGYTGSARFNFIVEKTNLHPWEIYLHLGDKANKYTPTENYSSVINIRIDARIDYGYFSAITAVPFVRLGVHDIIAGDEIFTAKEFFPELFLKKDDEPVSISTPGLYPSSMYSSNHIPMVTPVWTRMERNGDLWQRAAKVIFHNNKKAIGKVGENLVTGLLEQIKSRIGLFIEVKTLEL